MVKVESKKLIDQQRSLCHPIVGTEVVTGFENNDF